MEAGSAFRRLPLLRGAAARRARPLEVAIPAAPLAGEVRCAECSRTPLPGESATLHDAAGGPAWVCALCEPGVDPGSRLGKSLRRERIRSLGAVNVKRAG